MRNISQLLTQVILLGILLLLSEPSYSQHEADWWYFGRNANAHFQNNSVTSDTIHSAMWMDEGVSSFSHPISGDLLFYTNGIDVWSKDDALMPNGFNIGGHQSSSNSALIIPVPGQRYRFYSFSLDDGMASLGTDGLKYSIVDMRLNGGLGDVDRNFKGIQIGKPYGEKLTATKHASQDAYWVVVQGFRNNEYHSYLFDGTGFSGPIISAAGPVVLNLIAPGGVDLGCMKISPAGDQIAVCYSQNDLVVLMDFDSQTGRVSNPRQRTITQAYGLEFSPNGKYLYVSGAGQIHQLATGPNFTNNTPFIVLSAQNSLFNALQLAPNGKIYCAPLYERRLAVINSPDTRGFACNAVHQGHTLNSKTFSIAGLPNYSSSVFKPGKFFLENNCVGKHTTIRFKNLNFIDSVNIDFGDPTSGSANFSTNIVDSHLYSSAGKYRVQAILYSEFLNKTFVDTLIDSIEILETPIVNLGNDTAICYGEYVDLNAGRSDFDYLWHTGSKDHFFRMGLNGWHWVQVSNQCGVVSDSIYLTVFDTLIGPLILDTSFCSGDTLLLSPDSINGAIWSDGTSNTTMKIYKPGKYWGRLTNSCNTISDTFNVKEILFPVNYFGNDTVLCIGDTLKLGKSSNATKYEWNTGDTTSTIKVYRTGYYWIKTTNECGMDIDSTHVYFDYLPQYPMRDTVVCIGQPFIQKIEIPHSTKYIWNTGDTTDWISIDKGGLYSLKITNVCGEGTEVFKVEERRAPDFNLPNRLGICFGEYPKTEIDLNDSITSYTNIKWSSGSKNSFHSFEEAGVYTVLVENICGSIEDTIVVTNGGLYSLMDGQKTHICEEPAVINLEGSKSKIYWGNDDSVLYKEFYEATSIAYSFVDSNGCKGVDTLNVTRCSAPFFAPNSFTPNFDATNEGFRVFKADALDFEMTITDRWGKVIFETNDINNPWYGTDVSGNECDAGVYIYRVSFLEQGTNERKNIMKQISLYR
ncbi:MAG: gliding motility-associated C-terminal domain-containing protein [Salibacteraceae bacterium]